MKREDLQALLQSLGGHRRVFRHSADTRWRLLLSMFVDQPTRIGDLKRSPVGRLAKSEPVRQLLATRGVGVLRPQDVRRMPIAAQPFVITLGMWGDDEEDKNWNQTSRDGVNLVVQVNFDRRHDADYRKLDPDLEFPFAMLAHPVVSDGSRFTLAWARVDLDPGGDEALIEEIQSDWLEMALSRAECDPDEERDEQRRAVLSYVESWVKPLVSTWADLTMSATLAFLVEELGIRRVFHHCHVGSTWLKGTDCDPPRGLYSALPRRFCFTRVAEGPSFVEVPPRPEQPEHETKWFRLELPARARARWLFESPNHAQNAGKYASTGVFARN